MGRGGVQLRKFRVERREKIALERKIVFGTPSTTNPPVFEFQFLKNA